MYHEIWVLPNQVQDFLKLTNLVPNANLVPITVEKKITTKLGIKLVLETKLVRFKKFSLGLEYVSGIYQNKFIWSLSSSFFFKENESIFQVIYCVLVCYYYYF